MNYSADEAMHFSGVVYNESTRILWAKTMLKFSTITTVSTGSLLNFANVVICCNFPVCLDLIVVYGYMFIYVHLALIF